MNENIKPKIINKFNMGILKLKKKDNSNKIPF